MSSLMKNRMIPNPGLLGQEHYISKSWVVSVLRYKTFSSYKIGSTHYILRRLNTRTKDQNFFLLLADVLAFLVDFLTWKSLKL